MNELLRSHNSFRFCNVHLRCIRGMSQSRAEAVRTVAYFIIQIISRSIKPWVILLVFKCNFLEKPRTVERARLSNDKSRRDLCNGTTFGFTSQRRSFGENRVLKNVRSPGGDIQRDVP